MPARRMLRVEWLAVAIPIDPCDKAAILAFQASNQRCAMPKTDEERSNEAQRLNREAERLANDPKAIDELNQRVITEFRANKGQVGGMFEGMPVLLMTMKGAKTGRTLVRPVCYGRDGDTIVIIASYGGAPHNPPWYHNFGRQP